MPGTKRINAIFIYVSNMETMKTFYQEVMGLGKPVVETDLWVEYALEGAHLALHQSDPRIREKLDASKNTIKFSIEVDNIADFCARLKSKSVEIVFGPRKDFGSLLAEFKDPEGNLLRLIQLI
ncbi:MAG: VOC family protein [Candidatus Omnitrophota bacterium]